jgi:hypothetical protein
MVWPQGYDGKGSTKILDGKFVREEGRRKERKEEDAKLSFREDGPDVS